MSPSGQILVVNAGSTSLKLSLVADDERVTPLDAPAVGPRLAPLVAAVAHRIVQASLDAPGPLVLDDSVLGRLTAAGDLAPLHTRPALEAIATVRAALPGVPHVAVFDSTFHRTIPAEATIDPVPRSWREEWGIRRVGFHGLSVQWAAEQVRVSRLVVCHLGGGCSVTAVADGRSIDTTMGFSPLDGIPMATRSGTLDPAIVLYALRRGLSADEVEHALEHESGLLGLSGISSRVEVLERRGDGGLALAVFARRVAAAVAAMTAALGGLDALVFTGGVGEHSARVRADVCRRLQFLGVELDPESNTRGGPGEMAGPGSPVRVVVVQAREDVVAARAARRLLR